MGFYLRKSVRVGPLRFNLSGSGIGLSCGIPGLRIGTGPRGNYIHAGRGGFYYRKTFSAGKTHSFGTDQPNQQPTYQTDTVDPTLGQLEPVDAGTSALMQDTSSQSLLDELNEKHRRLRLWPWILLLAIATVATAIYLGLPALIIGLVTCAGAVAVILSTYRDTLKKTTVLLYDFDDDALGAFANLDGAFNQANASQCIWHVQSKAAVLDRKYHAGASSVIDTDKIRLSKSAPPGVKTNILPMVTPLGRKRLYFLPDRVLLLDAVGFGAISYQDLRVELEKSTFITGEVTAPSDARIVTYTWRYVNKGRGGGPDHRFHDNPQLPVIETGDLAFSTDSGFSAKLKFSNVGAAEALENGVHEFTSFVFRGAPKEHAPSSSAQPPPAPPTQTGEPPHSKIRAIVIAVIVVIAMITAMSAVYQWRKSSNSAAVSNRNPSAENVPVSMPAATLTVTLPTVTPPTVSQVSVVPSASVPTLRKTFGGQERFVTVISPVSIRMPSGKTVTVQSGSHFRLMGVERDQATIRYYDGRNYSIPISATDYR